MEKIINKIEKKLSFENSDILEIGFKNDDEIILRNISHDQKKMKQALRKLRKKYHHLIFAYYAGMDALWVHNRKENNK